MILIIYLHHIVLFGGGGFAMTISILSAAKRLGERSNWALSNLALQKLSYLSHMFFMGRHAGTPLVHGHFEAWDYGPVHPDLYHRAKMFGSSPVREFIFLGVEDASGPERDVLDEAYDALGSVRAGKLVNATHRPGGAWETNYRPGVMGIIIPNSDILAEYKSLERGK